MTRGSMHEWDFRAHCRVHEWDFRKGPGSNVSGSIVAVWRSLGGADEGATT
jgi:hypothetical protein